MTRELDHGVGVPFPQTTVVAHVIERYACSCFLLVRKNIKKIIKIFMLLLIITTSRG